VGLTAVIDGKRQKSYRGEWTREEAESALAELLLKIEPKAKGAGMTLAQAVDRYVGSKHKKSIEADKRSLALFASAFGGDTPLVDVTTSRISAWNAERLGMVCPQTHQSYSAAAINRLLRHLLRLAHEEWEELVSVPRIKLEREPQGRLRWLTLDRVDLSRGVIRLELTKSGRRREVPLNDDSYRALVALEPKPAGRVFQTRSIRTAFENAVETASLDDVTFHTMRHTFASWAMMRGVSLKELQELLGHRLFGHDHAIRPPRSTSAPLSPAWKGSRATPPKFGRKLGRKRW
jgi:integrase